MSCQEPPPGTLAAGCRLKEEFREWSDDVPLVSSPQAKCGHYAETRYSDFSMGGPWCWQTQCPPGKHFWSGRCVNSRDVYQRPEVCPRLGDVSPLSGLLRKDVPTDFELGNDMLMLTYDDAAAPSQDPPLNEAGDLGDAWFISSHRRVARAGQNTVAVRGDGELVVFHENDAGVAEARTSSGRVDQMTATPTGILYRSQADQTIERFDADGRLLGWVTRDGRRFEASIQNGTMIAIRDDSGRGLDFSYRSARNNRPLLERISSSDGTQSLRAHYEGNSLARLVRDDGSAQQFRYRSDGRLAQLIDENDAGTASFGYDEGRLVSSELANGVGRHVASYSTPPRSRIREEFDEATDTLVRYHEWEAPVGGSVSMPNGTTTQYTFTAIAPAPNAPARVRISSVSQPAGAGCGPASSHIAYDSNGNVRSRDDFNGHRVCYAYDGHRNLELVRVEGLPSGTECGAVLAQGAALPPGARKISTEWHPDWNIAVRKAAPGKVTRWLYNGQPGVTPCAPAFARLPDETPIVVLCQLVEVATTDATGAAGFAAPMASTAARRVSYTYNHTGRVLTEDGPRTDVNDVTTYAYYDALSANFSLGDLKSVTDAMGKTTRFTRYDGAGRLLEEVAPNGLVTRYTYDRRGHLLTTTIGGRTTTTAYDAVGQPVRVTRPDGSWQAASYDAAHRLVGTSDSRGTSVELRLDHDSNITARIVRSCGVVREQTSWFFDALGRVSRMVFGAPSGTDVSVDGGTASCPPPPLAGGSAGGTAGSGGGAANVGGGVSGGVASAGGGGAGACAVVHTDRRAQVCQRWSCDRQDMSAGLWSGDAAQCVAGDMPNARANALKLINLYRFLADLPAVTTSSVRDTGAQSCALMMTANNATNFSPPSSWACYAADGATAASQSSMCSGTNAVRCVDLQMNDFGSTSSNSLGGRRWYLSNSLGPIGIGSTLSHSCQWVIGGTSNAGRAWVAWPPPGPVPLSAIASVDRTGWSVQGYSANVTNATVTVVDNGQQLPVTVSNLLAHYGSPSAIKFVPNGWVTQAGHTYEVTVAGGGLTAPISYAVEVVSCP